MLSIHVQFQIAKFQSPGIMLETNRQTHTVDICFDYYCRFGCIIAYLGTQGIILVYPVQQCLHCLVRGGGLSRSPWRSKGLGSFILYVKLYCAVPWDYGSFSKTPVMILIKKHFQCHN